MKMRLRDYDAKGWIQHMMTISEKFSCSDRDTSLGIVVGASSRTVIVSSGHQSPKFQRYTERLDKFKKELLNFIYLIEEMI